MYCHRYRFSGSYLPLILSRKTILIILAVAAIAVGVACGGGNNEEPDPRTKNDLVDQRYECEAARLRLSGLQVSDSTVGGWQWEGYYRAERQSWESLKKLRDDECKALARSKAPTIATPTPDAEMGR